MLPMIGICNNLVIVQTNMKVGKGQDKSFSGVHVTELYQLFPSMKHFDLLYFPADVTGGIANGIWITELKCKHNYDLITNWACKQRYNSWGRLYHTRIYAMYPSNGYERESLKIK